MMQSSFVKKITKDKALETILPVKAIEIKLVNNGTESNGGFVFFIYLPFSLN